MPESFARVIGSDMTFVQDNHSQSKRSVLRGLHYQIQQPQGKLVRAIQGAVFDVAVDLRSYSETFGRWVGTELTADSFLRDQDSAGLCPWLSGVVG